MQYFSLFKQRLSHLFWQWQNGSLLVAAVQLCLFVLCYKGVLQVGVLGLMWYLSYMHHFRIQCQLCNNMLYLSFILNFHTSLLTISNLLIYIYQISECLYVPSNQDIEVWQINRTRRCPDKNLSEQILVRWKFLKLFYWGKSRLGYVCLGYFRYG